MDAVPGRKAPMESGSAPDLTYCQPCAEDGNKILPEAFCPVCKEFLCSNCARVHRNQKMTKSHTLQDNRSMPSSFRTESEDDKFTETCKRHTKEFIKYYCLNHETLLCGDCLAEKAHRLCNIERISQVAKQYKEGAEYNSLNEGLVQMVGDIGKLSEDIQAIMKSVDEESLTNINELRKFRNEINQYLDKRENELLAEIDRTKRTSKTLLNELKSKCTNMKSAIEKLKSELQAQDGNQLLIVGKRAIKELASLQTALEEVGRRRRVVPRYKFHRDPDTERLIGSEIAIGLLEEGESTSALRQQQRQLQTKQEQRQQDPEQQQHQPQKHAQAPSQKAHFKGSADLSQSQLSSQSDIPVKTSTDTSDCWVTSMALLPGDRLLLADRHNTSLKLVDTHSIKVVSKVKLQGQPWDLCILPADKAAVTLTWEEKIQFVSTQGNVTLLDVIHVDPNCYAIDFCDDNLIVSFSNPDKVVLMDMKGKVKKIVDNDSSGKPLFQQPRYLTVTRESPIPFIYISDRTLSTISKLNISLEVLKTFKDATLRHTSGLTAVGDNQLLVCGRDSDNIVLLDTFTGKITQLLGKEAGIEKPYSVAYCSLKKMIFVTCSPTKRPELENSVKVFNLV